MGVNGTTSGLGAFSAGATAALWAAALSLAVVAVLLALRLRADLRRDAVRRRQGVGLTRAYAELSVAKAAIEARSAQLEATLAGMSDGVMMLDAEFRLVQWNERFAEMTGVPRALLTKGRPMAEMIEAQARAGEFGDVDVAREVASRIERMTGGQTEVVVERVRPNGQVVELRRNPLPGGGSVTLYADITARRSAEAAQREANEAAAALVAQKAAFITAVIHEVTAPLETLTENLGQLARLVLPAGAGDPTTLSLQRALAAGDAMADLLGDILDMARLDAGQLSLQEADFALRPLVSEVIGGLAGRARSQGMVLAAEFAPGVPAQLHGDAGRLRQVLSRCVDHAVSSAAPGRILIRVSRLDLGSPMLRFAVADPGPRARPAVEEAGGASALAICERLVRLMGGTLGHAPGADGGNEVWLTLPLRAVDSAGAVRPDPVALAPAGRHRRRALVLLVEDMPVNQVVTATTLRREGHRVDVATSGAEALELLRRRPYDVVLMDLMMPGMSGYQTTAALRALPGPAGQVTVFALTATNAAADRARCLRAGMRGMLSKPVSVAELAAAVALDPAIPEVAPLPPAAAPEEAEMPAVAPPTAPEPAAAPSGLLLDAGRLDALRDGLPRGVFQNLARQCVVDMREHMMSLHEALETGSALSAGAAAHALAGMAANYGMPAIERRMRVILAAARQGDVAAVRAAGQGAAAELDRTDRALELLLQLHDA